VDEKRLNALRRGFLLRSLFGSSTSEYSSHELTSRRAYRDLCRTLAIKGHVPACGFTYDHAQKWVDMAAKCLVVQDVDKAVSNIGVLYVPIDSIVLREAAKTKADGELAIEDPFDKWTSIASYSAHLEYQESILLPSAELIISQVAFASLL
jgi:hypothetical protein